MEVDMNLLVFLATLVVAVFADSQRPHPTPPSPSYSIKSTPGVENKYYALQEDLMKPAPTIRASRKRQAKIQAEPEGLNLRHGAEDKLPEAVFPQEALGALGAVAQDSEGPKTVTLEHDAASVDHYTNEWVILVPAGEGEARKVAAVLGHEFLREAHGFQNFFVIRKRNHPEVNSNHSHHITQQLTAHESVETALQQVAKLREKRSVIQDQPQVVQEVIPVDHLRGLDAAEREQNRRNLESTADGMLRLREVAVRELVSAVRKSGLPIQPIIEMVKQEAARIGGLNVNEIEQIILRELTRLEEEREEERGHDVRADSAVHYESSEGMMASSVNEDDDASVEDEEDDSHTLDRRSPREEEPKVFFKTSPPERQVRSDEDLLLNDEILTVGHGIQLIPVQDSNESAVVLSATEVTIDNFTKLTIDIDKYNERYRDHPFDDGTDEDRLGETQSDNLLSVGNGILLRAIKGHTQVDVLTDQIINELNFFKQLVDFREFNYKFKRLNNKYADSDSEDDEDDEDEDDETGYETSRNEFTDSDAPGYETAAHELDRRSAPEEEADVPLDDAYSKSEIARLITETLQMGSDTSDSSLSGQYSAAYSDEERSKQSQLNDYLLRDSFTMPDSEFLVEVPDENVDSNDKYVSPQHEDPRGEIEIDASYEVE